MLGANVSSRLFCVRFLGLGTRGGGQGFVDWEWDCEYEGGDKTIRGA